MTTEILNPQRIDSFGRSLNKIWVTDKYSIKVEDENNVQVYNQLDTGESVDTGTTSLTNILGTNAITGEGVPTITTLADKEIFTLTIANDNTGDVTLKADNTPVKQCRINFDQQIRPRQLRQGMIAKFTYNLTADYYEWTNQNLTTMPWTKGADLPTAATLVIPNDGNFRDLTGSVTITAINGVKDVPFIFQMDSNPTFINSANIIIPGAADFIAEAGDIIEGWMLTDTIALITNIQLGARVPRKLNTNFDTVTVGNTTTETSMFSHPIPANALGINRSIRSRISGTYRNSSAGSANLQINLKYGASSVAIGDFTNAVNNVTPFPCTLDVYLYADDATGAQKGDFTFVYGTNVVNGQFQITGYGTASEDSAGALTMDVTAKHSIANAGLILVKESACSRSEEHTSELQSH